MKANLENDKFFLDLVIDGILLIDDKGTVVNNRTGKEIGYVTAGYKRINMFGRTCAINRLVYMVYKGEIADLLLVNHINGNKLDNNASNLELLSESENHKHAFATGLKKPSAHLSEHQHTGSKNNRAKLTDADVEIFRKAFENNEITANAIAAQTGMLRKAVVQMLKGVTYANVGFAVTRKTNTHE